MTKNVLLLTCATGALSLVAGVGQASAATATAAATDQGASVTEIVVTAEKREQSLQRVPVAVSVFTGAQRDTLGISTVADVTNFAPGFTYDPGNVHAYIRGIGRQSVNVTDDQRVANYEDEFYVYSPYGLDKSSLFLSQEQIERGPQSVGGREAPGGSIDMIRVRPTDHPYGELRATVGNFGTYEIEGAASGQVAPGLDVRVAGYDKNQNDGWFHNQTPGLKSEGNVTHEWYIEGQADWKPNEQWELWARASAEAWNNRGDAGSRVGFDNGSFDETNLTDGNAYVGGGLFVNPNYGYAAAVGGNPEAHAAVLAQGHDVIPLTATLLNGNVLDSPALSNHFNFISPLQRDVKLNGYDDFNYIVTYHAPGFDVKYNGGVQGYNYYLTFNGTDTGVKSFTLPGSVPFANLGVLFGLNNAFAGGAFPGCATCGFPTKASPGGTPLPAAVPLPNELTGTNLVINPLVKSNYVEDDWWTAHDLTFESTSDSPLQWVAGAFFYFQHYNQPFSVTDPNQPNLTHPDYALPGAIIGPSPAIGGPCFIPTGTPGVGLCGFSAATPAPVNPNNTILYADYKFNVETISGYGQLSYKINDQFKVSGDLRYSWDDKWGTENTRTIVFNNSVINGLSPFFGAATPSLDFTPEFVCLSGTLGSCNDPSKLARGVKSIGQILPNGYAQRQLAITSSAVTGNAKLEWTPTPDILAYLSYGRGYASPSFNAGIVSASPEVAPEFLNAYELGYKQSFGRQLLINMALFYYDYDDFQLPISIDNQGVTQGEFVNVPKARSDGFEFEGYWTPVKDLNFTLTYSFDDTAVLTGCNGTITHPTGPAGPAVFTPAAQPNLCLLDTNDPNAVALGARPFPGQNPALPRDQTVKGDPLPDAPRNKVATSVAYTWHYDPGDLTLSAAYVWRDSQTGAVFNRWYNTAPSWSDVDIRALWKGPNDRYEVIGYVKNVFNTLQYTTGAGATGLLGNNMAVTNAAAGLFQQSLYQINPPRTYGLEFRYKFF